MRQRTKTLTGILSILALIMMLTACGDNYGEIEDIISDQADITEKYVNGLEKAKNADDVVAVINDFTDGMKTLIPKIKTLQKDHPEFWAGDDIPKSVKAQQERLEAASQKVQGATMSLMKYMMDPKVQQAMQNMGNEMSKMQ